MRVIIKGNDKTKIAHEVARVMVTPYRNKCLVQFNLCKTAKAFAYEGDVNEVLYAQILDLTLPCFKETTIEEFTTESKSFDEVSRLSRIFQALYGTNTFGQLLHSIGLSFEDVDLLDYNRLTGRNNVDCDLIVNTLKYYIEKHPITFQDLRKFVFWYVDPDADYDATVTEAIIAIARNNEAKFKSLNISEFEVVNKIMGI